MTKATAHFDCGHQAEVWLDAVIMATCTECWSGRLQAIQGLVPETHYSVIHCAVEPVETGFEGRLPYPSPERVTAGFFGAR